MILTSTIATQAAPNLNNVEETVPIAVDTVSVEEFSTDPLPAEATKAEERTVTWKDNPNNCDTNTQYILADTFECKDKPKQVDSHQPATVHPIGCENYRNLVAQYNWNVNVALAVMKAESGCNPNALNSNHTTRDYSVGLFQINLYGANARTRPSETALKDPATNIDFAYKIYAGNGHSFIGQWGVCRKISCY